MDDPPAASGAYPGSPLWTDNSYASERVGLALPGWDPISGGRKRCYRAVTGIPSLHDNRCASGSGVASTYHGARIIDEADCSNQP